MTAVVGVLGLASVVATAQARQPAARPVANAAGKSYVVLWSKADKWYRWLTQNRQGWVVGAVHTNEAECQQAQSDEQTGAQSQEVVDIEWDAVAANKVQAPGFRKLADALNDFKKLAHRA